MVCLWCGDCFFTEIWTAQSTGDTTLVCIYKAIWSAILICAGTCCKHSHTACKTQVNVCLLSSNCSPFPELFAAPRVCKPGLTDALLTRQLPALNPATGSSSSDIRDKSQPRGLCHCPLRLCDYVSPVLPGGLWEHPGGLEESSVVQIWCSHDRGPERSLSLIIRLYGIQGHATDVCHLGLKMTAPSLSLLHY